MEHPRPHQPGKHDASSPLEQLYRKLRKLEELPIGTFLADVDTKKEIAEPLRQEIIAGHAYDAKMEQVVAELRDQVTTYAAKLRSAHALIGGYEEAVVELRREKRLLVLAAIIGTLAAALLTSWVSP